jgi:hypothetical protein
MQQRDYGLIGNLFSNLFKSIVKSVKGWKLKRYNRKVGKLIEKAEMLRKLTGYRYFVIKFKGRLRVLPKQQLKKWIANGTFKRGTSIHDLEKVAVYTTKISPKYT